MPSESRLPLENLPPDAQLRSGTAARLAGLPATTLRVWERRYQVVAAPKSAAGQRLYGAVDVQRLALLRRLTGRGHSIGTIAHLPLDALCALDAPEPAPGGAVAVVGPVLARRLAAAPDAPARIVQVTPDNAEAQAAVTPLIALLAHMNALQAVEAENLLALARRMRVPLTVVYRFGAEPVVTLLRAQGATVHREPVDLRALARSLAHAPGPVAPRRFSDADLLHLSALPTTVLCECPRHLAELVGQLAGFEQYSADCSARSPEDSALHRRLLALAGAARMQFEQALADVMSAEGLSLPGAGA